MADAYFEIEEYLWFDETIQGNVNVAGLVFDDEIDETLDLGPEEVLTVFSDVIEETLEFLEGDFLGLHLVEVSDTLAFTEQGGPPLRVRQSVLNLIMTTPVGPAMIANMHMDVLHGVDIFWEAVSSELQVHSNYVNAVPYWWEWIFESFWIDMTEDEPLPPIVLIFNLLVNDLVNMRHDIVQEYYFSSSIIETLFVWDGHTWGWKHDVASDLGISEAVQEIIGKVVNEYLFWTEEQTVRLIVTHAINDTVFAFDWSERGTYYWLLNAEEFEVTDGVVASVPVCGVAEGLGIGDDEVVAEFSIYGLATESLVFDDITAFAHDALIEEGIGIDDVELVTWVFNVLIECGFDATDIIS